MQPPTTGRRSSPPWGLFCAGSFPPRAWVPCLPARFAPRLGSSSATCGRWLDPANWPFPDASVIAFEDYQLARELRGKPTDDLSFDVSRGCHVGCVWCVDPLKGGRRDRRRPVRATVDFMAQALDRYTQF